MGQVCRVVVRDSDSFEDAVLRYQLDRAVFGSPTLWFPPEAPRQWILRYRSPMGSSFPFASEHIENVEDNPGTVTTEEPAYRREVRLHIPNADTVASAFKRVTWVGDEVLDKVWRVNGEWLELTTEESSRFSRDSIDYPIDEYALPTLLPMFDAGEEICACLAEMAIRKARDDVFFTRLGYTKEHVAQLLKARRRREDEESELTQWAAAWMEHRKTPTAQEALDRLLELHREAANQGPPLMRSSELPYSRQIDLDWTDLKAQGQETEVGWVRLVQFTAALVALSPDTVVISVNTGQFDDDVYVQTCREDGGALTIEAESNEFLEPPLSPDALNTLRDLGWEEPPGDGMPNYVQFLEADRTAPGEVAELLIDTLRRVYSARPNDLYRFEPQGIVRSLLAGEFGPELAANPALTEGQRARLYLGLRFPHDVGVTNS